MLRKWLIVTLATLPIFMLAGRVGTQVPRALAAGPLNLTANCASPAEVPFTIAAGVTRMQVTLGGARGASTQVSSFITAGGSGGAITATFDVASGQQYYVDLGCEGTVTSGGFNGGGNGGGFAQFDGGGGGGGATTLRRTPCGTLLRPCVSDANTVIVAGGGGGAGGGSSTGTGGGVSGVNGFGQNGGNGSNGSLGGGGAAPGPGAAGTGVDPSVDGKAGDTGGVGRGGDGGGDSFGAPGGGGGAGCHGGGGGSGGNDGPGAGGGGGSSCAITAQTAGTVVTYGVNASANGFATIRFFIPPSLTKSFNPGTIIPDAPSTLTFTLTNPNPDTLTSVSFSDDLGAAGIRVATAPNLVTNNCTGINSVGVTAGSTSISFSGISLAASAVCTVSLSVTATTPGAHDNVSSVATSAESGPGSVPATATLTVVSPDLVATKTNNATTLATVPFTWKVHIANQGVGAAFFAPNTLVFTDNLPNASITYGAAVPVTNPVGLTGTVACTIVVADVTCLPSGGPLTIAAGGSFDVSITATPMAMGSYANPRVGGICQVDPNNVVRENNGSGTAETNNGCSNTATFTDTSDLTITMTSSPTTFQQGENGDKYSILVANAGPSDPPGPSPAVVQATKATLGPVTVVVTLPPALTATSISGPGWTCVLATLTCTRSDSLPGGSAFPLITLTVNVAGNAPTSVTVTAVVSNPNEPVFNQGNNTAIVTNPVGVPSADLVVTKTSNPTSVLAGANVTYTLTVHNNGPDTALNVVLTDPIPANTTFVSATSDPAFTPTLPAVGSGPPAVVTFTAPSLANGATATFTVTVRANLTAPSGSVVNVANVSSASVDPNPANNVASATFGIGAPPPTQTPTPTATPQVIVVPVIPQVFQNPGAIGIFQPSRPTATPVRPAPAAANAGPSAVSPQTSAQPVILRPPSTGDAGLWRLPRLSAW